MRVTVPSRASPTQTAPHLPRRSPGVSRPGSRRRRGSSPGRPRQRRRDDRYRGRRVVADDEIPEGDTRHGCDQQDHRHRHAATTSAARARRRRAVRRAGTRRRIELGVLLEDRPLQPLQLRSRLQSQVARETAASVAIDVEGLGLASAAVEREHQLAPQPLAERVLVDAGLELGHDRAVPAEPQLPLDAALDRLEAELVEAMDLPLRELGERELAECRAAPEGERLFEGRDGAPADRRPAGATLRPRAPRTGVRRRRRHRGEGRNPAAASRAHRSPRPTRRLDAGVRRSPAGPSPPSGAVLPPQGVDEHVRRDHFAAPQREHRQERPLAPGRELQRLAGVVANLERAEDPELHLTSRLPSVAPPPDRAFTGSYRA